LRYFTPAFRRHPVEQPLLRRQDQSKKLLAPSAKRLRPLLLPLSLPVGELLLSLSLLFRLLSIPLQRFSVV